MKALRAVRGAFRASVACSCRIRRPQVQFIMKKCHVFAQRKGG